MILWIDAQLSPALAPWVTETFGIEAYSWEVRSILVETGDLIRPSTGAPDVRRLNAYHALRCMDGLQRWTFGGTPPVRYWSCNLGSFGSASGSRVGYREKEES